MVCIGLCPPRARFLSPTHKSAHTGRERMPGTCRNCSLDSRSSPREMHNQAHDKHHQEQKEADLSNSCRRKCDKSEPQGSSNQCNHQEHECVIQHVPSFKGVRNAQFLPSGVSGPRYKQDNPTNQQTSTQNGWQRDPVFFVLRRVDGTNIHKLVLSRNTESLVYERHYSENDQNDSHESGRFHVLFPSNSGLAHKRSPNFSRAPTFLKY